MDNLPNEIVKEASEFIPVINKKLCNKESYQNYLNSFYPINVNHWKPYQVYGTDFRGCMHNMYTAIIEHNMQQWFTDFNPSKEKGYMFSEHPNIGILSREVGSDGHSGATFGHCLRIMQDIFKHKNLKKWFIEPEKR
jgi:hypothetical protein